MRKDSDLLGELLLPDDVYYGAQTLRALQMYTPSEERINRFPSYVFAMATIKKACAIANGKIGVLDSDRCRAIVQACDEMIDHRFDGELISDMLCGGDLVAVHMNFNEVLACRANEILTGHKGFDAVQPNTHVNAGLSTCDSTYTAGRFALYFDLGRVVENTRKLSDAYRKLADDNRDRVKVSHTCFQDAAPIAVGQFYDASVSVLDRHIRLLEQLREESLIHAIGGTVIGTGLGVFAGFEAHIQDALEACLGVRPTVADCPFDDRQYGDYFLRVSGCLKSLAAAISKMARDIRIMSSGPRAGWAEITIAPVQNGSSFFPGKVNPSLPELMIMAAYEICGMDMSVTMAVEGGEVDCTPWYPVFIVNTLKEADTLNRTLPAFAERCVATIRMNDTLNQYKADRSLGMACIASALFGYKHAIAVAQYASTHDVPVKDAVVALGLRKSLPTTNRQAYLNVLKVKIFRKTQKTLYVIIQILAALPKKHRVKIDRRGKWDGDQPRLPPGERVQQKCRSGSVGNELLDHAELAGIEQYIRPQLPLGKQGQHCARRRSIGTKENERLVPQHGNIDGRCVGQPVCRTDAQHQLCPGQSQVRKLR